MSETTATRMRAAARIASFAVLAAAWVYAASLLWRAQVPALLWLALRPPRGWGGPLLRGLELALVALVASWAARFPFGLAAEWWERRYGISRQSYGAWLVGRLPSPGSVVALLVLVALGMLLARRFGRRWWVAAGPALAVGALALTLVQPLLGPALHPLRDRQLEAVLAGSGIRVGAEKV